MVAVKNDEKFMAKEDRRCMRSLFDNTEAKLFSFEFSARFWSFNFNKQITIAVNILTHYES